jgi:hypothetical protein
MKKRLNMEGITNELKGNSAFFPDYTKTPSPIEEQPTNLHQPERPKNTHTTASHDTVMPRNHDTTVSRHHATTTSISNDDIFEVVRRSVKHIGKEAATHRFTVYEKNNLADIEYTYKRQGIRTSENEITRIAINYFVEDYRKNGEESLLAQILKRINS